MYRAMCLTGLIVCAVSGRVQAEDSPHASHMSKCAKICADCQLVCDGCFHHCGTMVVEGKKDHAKCMNMCVDCGDCCKLCATLCARQSDLCGPASEFCAKSCEECATACEKFADDKKMSECAKTCRDCAKACRDMVKMMK